ncbi:MAG: hypothetical protein JWP95_1053 [Actinotalea sp.]|nr:hypothetical protein [Actinotalea sp.]
MIVPQYAPGTWFAVVTDGTVAVLPPSTDAAVVAEVWASLRDGGTLTEQVQVLLRSGIAAMPPFALVSVEGGEVHAIVRGGVQVDLRTAAGTTVLSGSRVSTWSEDTVSDVLVVAVRTPAEAEGGDESTGHLLLPVLSAVVRAAEVRVELRSSEGGSRDDDGAAGWASTSDADGPQPEAVPVVGTPTSTESASSHEAPAPLDALDPLYPIEDLVALDADPDDAGDDLPVAFAHHPVGQDDLAGTGGAGGPDAARSDDAHPDDTPAGDPSLPSDLGEAGGESDDDVDEPELEPRWAPTASAADVEPPAPEYPSAPLWVPVAELLVPGAPAQLTSAADQHVPFADRRDERAPVTSARPDDGGHDDLEQTLLPDGSAPAAQAPAPAPAPAPAAAPAPAPAPVPSNGVHAPTSTVPLNGSTHGPNGVHASAVLPGEDHDGMTVLSSDVVALRRQLPDWAGDAVPGPFAVPAPQTPPPAKMLLSSGLVVSLNRPVLLGRAPQVSRVSNRELPRLVTVASPNQDISRTHAEVRMDGEDVLVTDLRSTNGVLVLRQGAGPQRLHPGEPTVVEPGVVVDLGEGVTFTVERGA